MVELPIRAGIAFQVLIINAVPLKRFGKPEEVASLVVYLASAESNFVTGQAWNVCGGYLMD